MRSCYIISYDMAEGGDYEPLYKAIKSYGTWAHITESTWAIVTESDHKAVRDHISGILPKGSRLIVVKSANVGAWRNVICRDQWLKENL